MTTDRIKPDATLCRNLAKLALHVAPYGRREMLESDLREIAEQLTAAADVAERKTLTADEVRAVVLRALEHGPECPTGCSYPASCEHGHIATRAAKELAGATVDPARREVESIVAERDAYRAMVCDLLASAHPHPVEHPTMTAQWARARELLKSGPSSSASHPALTADEVRAVAREEFLRELEDHEPGAVARNGRLQALEFIADTSAARVAEKLAGATVGLSQPDRVRLESIRRLLTERSVCWDVEVALLDRLLAGRPQLTAAADLAERKPLTEDEIAKAVREAARVPMARHEIDVDFTLDRMLDATAEISAAKLAGAVVGLSAEERNHLHSIRALLRDKRLDRNGLWDAEVVTLDRLISAPLASAFDRAAVAITGKPAAELTAQFQPATASTGPADTAIIDQALGFWESWDNDAPHEDIARIRAALTGTVPS